MERNGNCYKRRRAKIQTEVTLGFHDGAYIDIVGREDVVFRSTPNLTYENLIIMNDISSGESFNQIKTSTAAVII